MEPFVFMTSVEAVQLTGLKAASLAELHEGLQKVDGSSLYYHTHRFYRTHSFLGPWDRSDFALWVGDNLKEAAVSESLGTLDPRDYGTLRELGEDILRALEPLKEQPERWTRRVPPGLEFHFCRAVSLLQPAGYEARDLEEFLHALERVDLASLYYHLIEAPLHYFGPERRFANDFSNWLAVELGMEEQARSVAEIDPYRNDLEAVRKRLLGVFGKDRLKTVVQRALDHVGREPEEEAAALWLRRLRKGA